MGCDGNDDCRLEFSFWYPNDADEEDGYELYVTFLPETYPLRFWSRVRTAWAVLSRGRYLFRDDMIAEKETVRGLSERLSAVSGRMKSRFDVNAPTPPVPPSTP